MESLEDKIYSVIEDGTKVYHFLQRIKNFELEVAINVIWAQIEKHGKNFDTMMSYLGQMVTKKDHNLQFIQIAKTENKLGNSKVVP